MFQVMIKSAYVVLEDEAGFTKYIEVTLDGYKSGVILDAVNSDALHYPIPDLINHEHSVR